ncbi:MAG: hypothetical protein NTX64_02270 [Elusimicrobia bacterium]|nr:hypothetical protein [Elusimicrobiota bacterium]
MTTLLSLMLCLNANAASTSTVAAVAPVAYVQLSTATKAAAVAGRVGAFYYDAATDAVYLFTRRGWVSLNTPIGAESPTCLQMGTVTVGKKRVPRCVKFKTFP